MQITNINVKNLVVRNNYLDLIITATTSTTQSNDVFMRLNNSDYYYTYNDNNLIVKTDLVTKLNDTITTDTNTAITAQFAAKNTTSATFSVLNITNPFNTGKLYIQSPLSFTNSMYIEFDNSNKPNYYKGNFKILNSTFTGGNYRYSIDTTKQTAFTNEVLTAKSVTAKTNTENINYFIDNNFNKNGIFKILNVKDKRDVGFLTNFKNKKIKYFNNAETLDLIGSFVYKLNSDTINDFGTTNLDANVSGTMSFDNYNTTIISKTFSFANNGYIKLSGNNLTTYDNLSYRAQLRTNNNSTDNIYITNVDHPTYINKSGSDEYLMFKYINPYGVYDSLLLFGYHNNNLEINKTFKKTVESSVNEYDYNITTGVSDYVDTVEINNKRLFTSSYLNYDDYAQFAEVLASKSVKVYDSRNNINFELPTKAEIEFDFQFETETGIQTDSQVALIINGVTYTINLFAIYTQYTFADDAVNVYIIPEFQAYSFLNTNYDFINTGDASIARFKMVAKVEGSLYTITQASASASASVRSNIAGKNGTSIIYDDIIIENNTFDYKRVDDGKVKNIIMNYRFKNNTTY